MWALARAFVPASARVRALGPALAVGPALALALAPGVASGPAAGTVGWAAGAAELSAQEIRTDLADLTVGGRLQVQYAASSVDDAVDDVFVRRARIRFGIRVTEWVDARIEPELAGDGASLQDAWVRLSFAPGFRLSMGQFKRAFSAFELSSSTDLPVVERDGRIEGLEACRGVGGPCSFSRLTEGLDFDGRDVGLRLDGALGGGLSYLATLTNGEGANRDDVNDGKSLSGRLEYAAGSLTVGAFVGLHDHPEILDDAPPMDTEYAGAGGVDVELGTWRSGFHLLAGAALGENREAGRDASFRAVQTLASWYVPTEHPRIAGVEPLLRVSWADPDDGADDAAGTLLTPGFMVYLSGKNGLSANVDVYTPAGSGDTEWSFKLMSYLYF